MTNPNIVTYSVSTILAELPSLKKQRLKFGRKLEIGLDNKFLLHILFCWINQEAWKLQ